MPTPHSKIVLTDRFDDTFDALRAQFPNTDLYRIESDEFLIEHAREAVAKAFLTSDREKIIVLAAKRFTPIAQNKLLKILEEPPPKAHFVLLIPSKSGLLATIRSRLVIENRETMRRGRESGVDLHRFDLQQLYDMLQKNRRIDAKEAKEIVETLSNEVMASGLFRIDEALLRTFDESIRLLDMGSPPNFVLSRLGLKILERKA